MLHHLKVVVPSIDADVNPICFWEDSKELFLWVKPLLGQIFCHRHSILVELHGPWRWLVKEEMGGSLQHLNWFQFISCNTQSSELALIFTLEVVLLRDADKTETISWEKLKDCHPELWINYLANISFLNFLSSCLDLQ